MAGSPVERPDLYEVLVHYGWSNPPYRPGWLKMRCGVHDDAHASAAVNYDIGRVKCFGCAFSGDVYNVIMYEEGCGFRDARAIGKRFADEGGGSIRAGARGVSRSGSPRGSGNKSERRGWTPPRLRR